MTEEEFKTEILRLDNSRGKKQLDREMELLLLLNKPAELTPLMERMLKARLTNRLAAHGYGSIKGLSHETVVSTLGPYAGLRYRAERNVLIGKKQEDDVPEKNKIKNIDTYLGGV